MAVKDKNTAETVAITLGKAAAQFILTLPLESRTKAQPEIYKFVRWYGENRKFDELSIPEVANYSDQTTSSVTDHQEKLAIIKSFLAYSHKQGLTKSNLAVHLKTRKNQHVAHLRIRRKQSKDVVLTENGRAELEAELQSLKSERPLVVEEIHKAAADKDFRENAPLEAARERQGQLEAKIRELEAILKSAQDMNKKQDLSHVISIGDMVLLREPISGEEIKYSLVDAREANPAEGKISVVSPVGQAILGLSTGDIVKIRVPAGDITYQILDITRR